VLDPHKKNTSQELLSVCSSKQMSKAEGYQREAYSFHSPALQTRVRAAQSDCLQPARRQGCQLQTTHRVQLWKRFEGPNSRETKRRRAASHTAPSPSPPAPGHGALQLPSVNLRQEEPPQTEKPQEGWGTRAPHPEARRGRAGPLPHPLAPRPAHRTA